MAAFFDDSGAFIPEDSGNYACFGMLVIPTPLIRTCGNTWQEMLELHFQCPSPLRTIGIEVKSSELCDMLHKLKRGKKLQDSQQKMLSYGLDNVQKVDDLINDIITFLAEPPTAVKYLAAVANKREVWNKFQSSTFSTWGVLAQQLQRSQPERQNNKEVKKRIKALSNSLSASLVRNTYEFLLQRVEYMSRDEDYKYSDAFIIGDESAASTVMLRTQAEIQAGLGKHFSQLQTIVNREWFGSSLHEPCLQMADWLAFLVRVWAEGSGTYSNDIKRVLPSFRGYPDKVLGSGIILCPDRSCFPNLPQKLRHEHIV